MLANGKEEHVAVHEQRQGDEWSEIEHFAEQTSSHVLVPEDALISMIQSLKLPRRDWDISDVRKLANVFRITPLAMATRLRSSGILS